MPSNVTWVGAWVWLGHLRWSPLHLRSPPSQVVLWALWAPAWDRGPEWAALPALSLPLSGGPAEGVDQSPVITSPPAKGVFQRHHCERCAGFPHERGHVPGVRALAAGHPREPRRDQPLSARSVCFLPSQVCRLDLETLFFTMKMSLCHSFPIESGLILGLGLPLFSSSKSLSPMPTCDRR